MGSMPGQKNTNSGGETIGHIIVVGRNAEFG